MCNDKYKAPHDGLSSDAAITKERPILFSGPMVLAILKGTKTQTRRVMKVQPSKITDIGRPLFFEHGDHGRRITPKFPYGQPGDRLWVRESTERYESPCGKVELSRYCADKAPVLIKSSDEFNGSVSHWAYPSKTRPSIHMPRRANRITLEITGLRVERLKSISESDAKAEGVKFLSDEYGYCGYGKYAGMGPSRLTASQSFESLWESINGPRSWNANPWVWVVEFKRITP